MAEYAQKSIEEMLPEIDRMKRIGLFTIEETRAIMKKRKRFEYKTQRKTKEKEVYLQYIQYEISVMQLIKLRREKKGIDIDKDMIEKPIALRIYKLFRTACFRFKEDVKLWLTHIDFAKKNMDKERVSKLFTTMLKVHNKKPNLWIMAAKFEFEVNESIETARNLFQRALRLLPEQKKLWTEYFKMELMCVDLIMKRKELLGLSEQPQLTSETSTDTELSDSAKVEDAILSCKIVQVVFMNAVKQAQDNIPELIFKMIKIANDFKFTKDLINLMYKFIEENENINKFEESWDVLARRSLLEEENIMKACEQTGQCADFTIAEFEEKAVAVYLGALEQLKTQKMHHIYLDFCIERLKLNSAFLNEERFIRLNEAFKSAQSQYGLTLEYTTEWVESLIKFNKPQEAIAQLEIGLAKYATSLVLWKLYLTVKIQQTNEENQNELVELFNRSVKNVPLKNSLEIWKLFINWCMLNNHEKTEEILQEGSRVMNQEISTFSRLKYLNWSLQSRNPSKTGLTQVRKLYQNLRQIPPFDISFYEKYIEIEKCATVVDELQIEAAYEDALIHFGTNNCDLWISFIEFLYSKSNNKELQQVSNAHWRAMKSLSADLVEEFTQKFCLFKINLDGLNTLSTNNFDIDMEK